MSRELITEAQRAIADYKIGVIATLAGRFYAMDRDNNNSVDTGEWDQTEKTASAYSKSCKAAEGSWCPCQGHPEKPECQ